ncbi:TatD family hydrolase [Paenibacillus sp. PsM32]|uniref:TatD family hydrolase n=1 Tax=Paenibacillus sp. PsM32 TaxID=3030536 RepID=UPI00263B2205|nr:TatD family hydrolase [Paenibacillus sp. PsM32]MDN4619058.1 TatD family hydrolase [Paenibacillus sp. PsM32]
MKNFIDFHVHIDYYSSYQEIYKHYDQKKIYALFVTNFPEVFKKAKRTFPDSRYVKIALGYHPEMLRIKPFNQKEFDEAFKNAEYIGEVGLDFSKPYIRYKEEQLRIFRYICKKAASQNKIMSIHSRKAVKEVLSILKEYGVKRAVFHWYTGGIIDLKKIIERGYYLSLNPAMLKTKAGKEIIKNVPLQKILIETDGPFSKYKSHQIRPQDIPSIYNDFEEQLGTEELRNKVFENLKRLLSD